MALLVVIVVSQERALSDVEKHSYTTEVKCILSGIWKVAEARGIIGSHWLTYTLFLQVMHTRDKSNA